MYLLAWIFIGVLVGWGAGKLLVGNTYGPFMDIAMGITGAVGGGYFMPAGFALETEAVSPAGERSEISMGINLAGK